MLIKITITGLTEWVGEQIGELVLFGAGTPDTRTGQGVVPTL